MPEIEKEEKEKPNKKPKTKKEKERFKKDAVAHAEREILRNGFVPGEVTKNGDEIQVRITWKRPKDNKLFNVGQLRIPRFIHEMDDREELFDFITRRLIVAVDGAAREPITRDK